MDKIRWISGQVFCDGRLRVGGFSSVEVKGTVISWPSCDLSVAVLDCRGIKKQQTHDRCESDIGLGFDVESQPQIRPSFSHVPSFGACLSV
jgi:hypothetical protein